MRLFIYFDVEVCWYYTGIYYNVYTVNFDFQEINIATVSPLTPYAYRYAELLRRWRFHDIKVLYGYTKRRHALIKYIAAKVIRARFSFTSRGLIYYTTVVSNVSYV